MREKYIAAGKEAELRNLLAMHHIRYCYRLARKYTKTTVDFDEMIGRAVEGLFIAASKFDFKRDVRFITYAQPYIFRGIMAEYYDKSQQAINAGVSLNRQILNGDDKGDTLADIIAAPEDPTEEPSGSAGESLDDDLQRSVYLDVLRHVLETKDLEDVDRYIFMRAVVERKSMRQVASAIRMPYHIASQRLKDTMQSIRTWLSETRGIDDISDIL
jgi:RNA polymerase sigma factor (sigma-70 family)